MKKILAIAMAALTLLAVGCSKPAEEVITIETVNTPAPVVTPNVPEVTPTPEVFVPSYTEKIAAKKAAYRVANRGKYNAYMRDYLRKRREVKKLSRQCDPGTAGGGIISDG